jgi:hypothetical protein
MKTNLQNLMLIEAKNACISELKYLDSMKRMITESQELDPTVVLHSDKEILERFNHSVIAIIDNDII